MLETADAELAREILDLAAAAGCPVRRSSAERPSGGAGLRLVDEHADPARVAGLREAGEEVVLVGLEPAAREWWVAAADLDVPALELPAARSWLLDRLLDAVEGGGPGPAPGVAPGAGARVVGVLGGRGGAGASVLAAALATTAAEDGIATLLVDADPCSGGVDLLLGGDELPGLRWSDLLGVEGRLSGDVLRGVLRMGPDLGVLAQGRDGRGGPAPETLRSVLEAARRGHELVVVDLPRPDPVGADDGETAVVLPELDDLLLILPTSVRAAAAGCGSIDRVRERLRPDCRVGAVVRLVGVDAPAAEEIADAVGLPLVGVLRSERDLDARLERGEGLPPGRRSPLRLFARRWLSVPGPR
ncbi:septum site-determining protein Ssd [Kineococcus gynurae]|uniref:Septum site-determining protein Ssd n=1 Tax=Kineococcus gynurae TaxID=452979 RepID=A0ABV5LU18_9ACTN